MNPWVLGLQIVVRVLSVVVCLVVVIEASRLFWQPQRIEKIIARPYPRASDCRWLLVIGALVIFAFPFLVEPHLGIRLSLTRQLSSAAGGAVMFLVLMGVAFKVGRKIQTWQYPVQRRFTFIMLGIAAIGAFAALYLEFFR